MDSLTIVIKILTIIGALGFFLYGMKLMSESLQKVAGNKMRQILTAMTSKPARGILSGLLVTAIIQSSSASTVMVVSFVNAGLLSLSESIGLIMGANIGTTVTAWIISLLGFGKTFDINIMLLPLIAIGLPLFFSKKGKNKSMAELIFGFVILFMGLSFLKSNVPEVEQGTFFFEHFSTFNETNSLDLILFVGIGILITMIFQSSSATIALTFVIAIEGWVSFPLAAAMVLGENIGTSFTAIIASFVANRSAKRSALAHLLFNVIGVLWALILFKPLLFGANYFTELIGFPTAFENPASIPIALSAFHTTFNLINTLILVWFIPAIASLTKQIIRGDAEDEEKYQLKFIGNNVFSTSELSLIQARKEVSLLADRVKKMFNLVPELLLEKHPNKYQKLLKKIYKQEDVVDNIEIEIAKYLTHLSDGKLSESANQEVRAMLKIIDDLESMADNCNNMARIIDHKNEQNAYFTQDLRNNLRVLFDEVVKAFDLMISNLDQDIPKVEIWGTILIERNINQIRDKLKEDHFNNVKANKYPYQTGVFYSELISQTEKIGDYIINVSEAIDGK
jgi:phosphate:Na+ symporter